MKRDFVQRIFTDIPALKGKALADIKCWNFSAIIDEKKNLYVWGALVSSTFQANSSETPATKPAALCIKQPEQVSSLRVHSIEIGQSMAFAIEYKTKIPFVIGTNQSGELGLSKEDSMEGDTFIDKESRKTFLIQEALKEKPVEMVAVGKSGFILAIGKVVDVINED